MSKKKITFSDLWYEVTEFFNFPRLLLAILLLFNVKLILNCFITYFRYLFDGYVYEIIHYIPKLFLPVIPLLLFLVVGQIGCFKKSEHNKLYIGIFSLVFVICNLLVTVPIIMRNSYDLIFIMNVIIWLIQTLAYLTLAVFSFLKIDKYIPYYCILCAFILISLPIHGALLLTGYGAFLSSYSVLIELIALLYIPTTFKYAHSDYNEISDNKIAFLVTFTLFLFIFALVGSVEAEVRAWDEMGSNVFKKDPNSWTSEEIDYVNGFFEWLDANN